MAKIASVSHSESKNAQEFIFRIPDEVNVSVGDIVVCTTVKGKSVGFVRKTASISNEALLIVSKNFRKIENIVGKVSLFEIKEDK